MPIQRRCKQNRKKHLSLMHIENHSLKRLQVTTKAVKQVVKNIMDPNLISLSVGKTLSKKIW